MMQLGESPGVALVCLRHCSPRGQALRVAQRCARMWLLKELQLDHDPVPEDAVPSLARLEGVLVVFNSLGIFGVV